MKKTDATRSSPRKKPSSAVPARDVNARSVRWLAELCGLPDVGHLPQTASELVAQREYAAGALAHAGWWARHPDAGSNFARANLRLSELSDSELFAALSELGYDGLLYRDDREIVGHCFFQRHDNELHAFSVWVAEPYRGGALMATACFDFIAYASARPGIVRARFGAGQWGDRLLRPLKQFGADLGWRLRKGAWVEFPANDREPVGR